MVKDEDQSLVVIRPKYYVPSTGSAWASDFLRLRYENPKLFEMTSNGREFSDQFRRAMAIVNDCLFYFVDGTTKDDLNCLVDRPPNYVLFKKYELSRLTTLTSRLENAELRWKTGKNKLTCIEIALAAEIFDKCREATEPVESIKQYLNSELPIIQL